MAKSFFAFAEPSSSQEHVTMTSDEHGLKSVGTAFIEAQLPLALADGLNEQEFAIDFFKEASVKCALAVGLLVHVDLIHDRIEVGLRKHDLLEDASLLDDPQDFPADSLVFEYRLWLLEQEQ
ncbi:hypothetical protein ILUMI_04230, partial [Ignelater luminosus]